MARIELKDLKEEKVLESKFMGLIKGGWDPWGNWQNNVRLMGQGFQQAANNWQHNVGLMGQGFQQAANNWVHNTRMMFGWWR